jgi:hypothetical protein
MKKTLLAVLAVSLSACAPALKTNEVALGMSKDEVIQKLGAPHGVISSERLDNNLSEVLEYRRDGLWWGDLDETYWFYFNDNKLEKWGRPGDHLRYME